MQQWQQLQRVQQEQERKIIKRDIASFQHAQQVQRHSILMEQEKTAESLIPQRQRQAVLDKERILFRQKISVEKK